MLDHRLLSSSSSSSTFISPAHTRTEGLASVWGSEFTTQVATPQGGFAEIAPERKIVESGGGGD
jgi:hypothetical protein